MDRPCHNNHKQPASYAGFDFTYADGPGDHTWGQIQNVLDWLPLTKK